MKIYELGEILLDRYEVFARYEGGMAFVYGVCDAQDGKRYAAKTYKDGLDGRSVEESFRQEIAIGLELDPHPGILRLRFAEEIEGRAFAFFDFIEGTAAGRTLHDQLDAGEVTPTNLGSYALQLARALSFLSSKRSTAHLDLKPSNILVTADEILKVSDFGLARSVALFQCKPASAWAGSPSYMAPEQKGTGYVDERSDVFAFGVILYEILTGTPCTAPAKRLYWQGLPRASLQPSFRAELGERTLSDLGTILGGCLDELSDRIQSFAEVVRGLETIFTDVALPPGEDEQPSAKVQRARSWQVIGEHSRALRELNRLLLGYPNLPGADEAVVQIVEALNAVPSAPIPQLTASTKTCDQELDGEALRQFVLDSTRTQKYATALRVVLAALRRSPGDESILMLATLVVRQGMSRSTHFEAAATDEELDEQSLSDPLLDAIFCECSEPECGADWIPLGELLRGALHAHVLNMVGGRCRKCGRVFCRKHFGHSQMGVDASTAVCRYDGSPLEPIEKATGRRRRREAEATTPCRHVLFMREGPVTPDIPYVTKALDALVPGSLSAGTIISPRAVTRWANLELVARGFLEHLSGFDENLTVETTDAVFDGDRVFIARTFASPSADEDIEVRFDDGEPSGAPADIARDAHTISDVFTKHVERMHRLATPNLTRLVARAERLIRPHLLVPTSRAALVCIRQALKNRRPYSTSAMTRTVALLVTALPEVDSADSRACFPKSYLDTLWQLIEGKLGGVPKLDIAHWILCSDGERVCAYLAYIPIKDDGLSPFMPVDLLTEDELRGLGGPLRTVQRSGQEAASSVGDTVVAELEQAVAAIRAARVSGYSGIDEALRPTGIVVLRFLAGQERPYLVHARLLSHLIAEGLLSDCKVFRLDMGDTADIVGFIFITGPVDAMKAYPRAYLAREAETLVERECDGQWSRIEPAFSATDIPAPGCALELAGAARAFDAVLSAMRSERGRIVPVR